jgi:hypothetical protein
MGQYFFYFLFASGFNTLDSRMRKLMAVKATQLTSNSKKKQSIEPFSKLQFLKNPQLP